MSAGKAVEKNIEVDENDNVIGLRPRDDFYTGRYIHRSVNLILFNNKNEILIQKRVLTKKWYPGLWTYSVSGTVADESYEDCMKKEMREEIGISVPAKFLFKFLLLAEEDKAVHAVFSAASENKIKPDLGEMSEIKWVPAEELKADIARHPEKYTPAFAEGMNRYFAEFFKA